MNLTANISVNIVITILKVRKKGLRHVSTLEKSQPMNWKKCLEGRPVGFLLQCHHESRALPLGPLATPHFFMRGLMDTAREAQDSGQVQFLLPHPLCGLQKSLNPCCLDLPICKMEIKFHCGHPSTQWSCSD